MPETVQEEEEKEEGEVLGSFKVSSPHLQYLVDACKRVTDECRFKVKDGLLSVFELDPAHVALVRTGVPLVEQGLVGEFGVDLDRLHKVLKPVPLGEVDPIEFIVEERWVHVDLPGSHRYSYKQFPTDGMVDPKLPKLDLPVKLAVNARTFWDAVRRAHDYDIHDHFKLSYGHGNGLVLSAASDNHAYEATLDVEDMIRCEEPATSFFSLDYLKSSTCAKGWQGTAHIQLGTDYPIIIKSTPGDASIEYTCAPRVKST